MKSSRAVRSRPGRPARPRGLPARGGSCVVGGAAANRRSPPVPARRPLERARCARRQHRPVRPHDDGGPVTVRSGRSRQDPAHNVAPGEDQQGFRFPSQLIDDVGDPRRIEPPCAALACGLGRDLAWRHSSCSAVRCHSEDVRDVIHVSPRLAPTAAAPWPAFASRLHGLQSTGTSPTASSMSLMGSA